MLDSLIALKSQFKKNKEFDKLKQINYLIKKASLPGVDVPADEIDIDGIDNALKHLDENRGLFIYLDNPMGSTKRFGKDHIKMPFHYGEFTEIVNPADDMGWDLVIAPSACEEDVNHIKSGHNLEAVGYVPVNEDEDVWAKETASKDNPNGKKPPFGNHKIILAPNKAIENKDKNEIEDFFEDMWQFDEIVWL